jgi:multiple RNA-binding domain-containing protein 1
LQDAPEPEATNTATLYVRNLNFSTTTERLTEAFKPLSGFRSATVKTKTDPKRGVLSMGFGMNTQCTHSFETYTDFVNVGFVEFNNPSDATAALRALNGHELEGHKLAIQASHRPEPERRREDLAGSASTKLVIRNLPFEANVRFFVSPTKRVLTWPAEEGNTHPIRSLRQCPKCPIA